MPERIVEYAPWRGNAPAVDAESGVIRGVKILGLRSRNGRIYRADALRRAVALYEEAKVNVNHPADPHRAARDYRDRLGRIRNVRFVEEEGLFGDLHFNPKHPVAAQLAWDAEHAPENVGLSHHVSAVVRRKGETVEVEAIEQVLSVDLVADPATTDGLFEHAARQEAFDPKTLRQRLENLEAKVARLSENAPQSRDPLSQAAIVRDGRSLAKLLRQ
ncbi:hypothetical protein JCM19992_02680 [Thermostilla marina]